MFHYFIDNPNNEEGYKPDNQAKTPFDDAVENFNRLRDKYPDNNLSIFDRLLLDAKEKELIEKRKKTKK